MTGTLDDTMSALDRARARIAARLDERGTYRRWVLVTALVGMFSTSFPVTILTVSLGDIGDDFGASETTMTWVISGPMLASAVALPVLGKLGDLRGQRKVFLAGFSLATLVAGLTAFAWNPLSLIGLRMASQVIGSATQPTSMALIMRAFPKEERVKALGWWSLVAAGAPAIGLAVGGPLVELVGWRAVFVVQAGLAILPVIAATLVLRETPPAQTGARFDIAGSAALALAAGGLLFGLSQSAEWGWQNPFVIAGFVLAPIATVLFIRTERRVTDPLLPLEMVADRNVSATLISQGLAGAAYMGSFVITPFLMRGVFDWTLTSVAALMLLRPLSFSLSSPIGGRIGMRIGERSGALIGTIVLAGSMAVFAVGAFTENVVLIGVALVCQGVGNGVASPSLGATLANSVDEQNLGVSSATQRMARLVGNSVGIALMTAVYAGSETTTAFGRAYLAAFILGLLAVAATYRIIDRDPSSDSITSPEPMADVAPDDR